MDNETWQRIDVEDALSRLSAEETDACANVLSGSQHTSLKIMPNHHIDSDGDLRGFMFTCSLSDKAEVLPINKRMCDMTSLYECSVHVDSDQIFHPDALRIINDCDTYIEKMKDYIKSLKHCTNEPAGFACISDNSTSSSHTKDRREHKLYIVVSGWPPGNRTHQPMQPGSYGHFTSPTPSMSHRGIFNKTHLSLNQTPYDHSSLSYRQA